MMSVCDIVYRVIMSRWESGARDRLMQAAATLFLQQGYEATTVADIAAEAGVTERTFFRYFSDKREVLFGDPTAYNATFTDAIAAAPAKATPIEAVTAALRATGTFFRGRHQSARLRQRIIDANPALQERELIKRQHLIESIDRALQERGTPEPAARLTAELAAIAFHEAFSRWLATDTALDLGALAVSVLNELRRTAGWRPED